MTITDGLLTVLIVIAVELGYLAYLVTMLVNSIHRMHQSLSEPDFKLAKVEATLEEIERLLSKDSDEDF